MLVGMCVTWLHSRGKEYVCGHSSWPRDEQEKNIPSFLGGMLSFLKLDSVLAGFSVGVSNFS